MAEPLNTRIINKSSTFQADLNNTKYEIKFKYDLNNLFLKIENLNDIPHDKYFGSFSLKDLGQLSDWFKTFDTIDSVYKEILNLFGNKKMKFAFQDNIVDLLFEVETEKDKSLKLSLKKCQSSNEEIIKQLINTFKQNKEENKALMDSFKTTQDNLEKRVKNLENHTKLNEIQNKEENKNNIDEFNDSDILNNEDKNTIKKWFNPDNNKRVKLLYKAKRDGDTAEEFYNKCENKGPTITIVLSTDGNRFGGYTSLSWKKPNFFQYYPDEKAFIFSLNKGEKYFPIEKEKYNAVCMWVDRGPTFGGGNDLTIENNCLKNNKSHNKQKSYQFKKEDINGENQYFTVKDYEVYSIEDINKSN